MTRIPRSLAEMRALARDTRYLRRLAADTARDHMPPPPSAFGSYGHNTYLVPPTRVSMPSAIFLGDNVTILEHAFLSVVAAVPGVEPRLSIGSGTNIGVQANIACVGEIEIGDNVLTAARIFIGDTYHRYQDPDLPVIAQPMAEPKKVVIEQGSFLGIGSAVLMGVHVGEHAYIAAGAVVTEDVDPFTLVAGNPAQPVRRWDASRREWVKV